MQVAPRQRITAGEPVTIFGRLVCHGRASAAGQVVKLFHHLPGTPGFTYVQSTTTEANGFYQFQPADGVVETNRIWHVRAHGAQSPNRGIWVAAQVTLNGPAEGTQILTGNPNKVTFTGTVKPADAGARVLLERHDGPSRRWHKIDEGEVDANGDYSIVHAFIVPGDASLRTLVLSQRRNVPSASTPLNYDISQAQNSALTIVSSADPISYGQSVTVSGVLAGGASKAVTLLARTAKQQSFAPVAQATTDGAGNYVFPTQVPLSSTYYEVQGGGQTSAVLYEGVKDLLVAQVSASSIPEGQPLVFTGSVAPSHPGHIIYLERRNAAGDGYHVVQVGTLSAQSTFSLSYAVYSTGTQVFRVYIPGGPENGDAASQPFTVQVTPVVAALLKPEAPGNSSQPSEGAEAGGDETSVASEGSEGPKGPGERPGGHGPHHGR
jgi:hypothetical protein